jgi:hypothetical protein
MSVKIIFLDFDGVLNNVISRRGAGPSTDPGDETAIWDPSCVDCINEILRSTEAKIVVSSAWRCDHSVKRLRELLSGMGVELEDDTVVGTTPIWKCANGLIRSGFPSRAEEIRSYLAKHIDISNYAIIDDGEGQGYEMDEDPVLSQHLVKTDDQFGLTPAHIEKVIGLLSDEEPDEFSD